MGVFDYESTSIFVFYKYLGQIMENKKTNNPKLRIKLKSYDFKALDSSVWKIMWNLIKSWAVVKGPIPLPKKRKLYTVLKSHFVYKDSRDQYERFSYSRLIDVVQTWSKTVEYLQNLVIPVWVSVEVRVY